MMTDQEESSGKVFSESDCDSDAELITRTQATITDTNYNHPRSALCPCIQSNHQYSPHMDHAPRDKLNLVYICFFLAGGGFLFPFNSFISAIDYFYCLYRAEFSAVSEIIPMTYLVTTLLMSTLNLLAVERLSINLRIGFGYVMFTAALFFVPMLDIGIHNGTVSTGVSFYLTLASVLVVGLGSGFQQSTYYGLSSMLPPRYSQALLAGESVAGFVVALNRIFTKLVFSERVGAIVFFVVSLLFVWLCVGCYFYIMRSPFVKYHTRKCREESGSEEQEMKETSSLGDKEGEDEEPTKGQDVLLIQNDQQSPSLRQKITGAIRIRLVIVSQIWRLMVAIFTNYLITLLIFPGLLSEIQYNPIGDWSPVILITLFNFADFVAKWLGLIKIRCWTSTRLMLTGFLRLVLIPIAIMCVSPSPCEPVLAVGIMGWAVVLTVVLGLSNGYFGSVPMINVSMEVKKEKDRELAGTIMIWTLLLGLSTGSVLAYAVTPLTKLDTTCTLNTTCLAEPSFNETYR